MLTVTKRIYEPAAPEDGCRILVDRLWPRGLSKEAARVDVWLKAVAPSAELRKWFGHDVTKWPEFKARYFNELAQAGDALEELRRYTDNGKVTLLYAASDREHNNAVALQAFLESQGG